VSHGLDPYFVFDPRHQIKRRSPRAASGAVRDRNKIRVETLKPAEGLNQLGRSRPIFRRKEFKGEKGRPAASI